MDAALRERLDAFIERKGLRRTQQRDTIAGEVFSKDDHFTAEELFERVRKSNSGISRATVYRTLGLLVEAGLLREIDLGEQETTYDADPVDAAIRWAGEGAEFLHVVNLLHLDYRPSL